MKPNDFIKFSLFNFFCVRYTNQKRYIEVYIIFKKWFVMLGGLFLFIFGACGAEDVNEEIADSDIADDAIRVAAVGDSITDFGISGANYPEILDDMLGENYAVVNFGRANYAAQASSDFPYETTDTYEESLKFNPEIVIFMLGTNDTKASNWNGAEAFQEEYTDLLEDYIELDSVSRIILASPPTVFLEDVMGGSIDPEVVESIRDIVEVVAEEHGLEFVDMTEETANHSEWFFDGIHPNEEGAEALARNIL